MAFHPPESAKDKKRNPSLFGENKGGKRKKLKKILAFAGVLLLIAGGLFYYRASAILGKISTGSGGLLGGLLKSENDVKGVPEGRTNVLVLGERGNNMPGGDLLTDTIMVISIKPGENKAAMISVPRDLYVDIPGHGTRKINEANPLGEQAGKDKGMETAKQVVENVTGLPIHYVVLGNFEALREIVNTLGGITVHLDKPFSETSQFVEGNECGGAFSLPAGDSKLSGDKALCYSRARYGTNDFDRARRQQDVILAIKDKALSIGTLADFSKASDLAGTIGNNIRTTMEPWEMQKLFGIYQKMQNPIVIHKVFDDSPDGLLYSTMIEAGNGRAYILLPKGGNFDKIKEACRNIFN
jgi:LCP family protein required for cell wall assembly